MFTEEEVATIKGLAPRLSSLEQVVHNDLIPKLDRNSEMTATTSAMVDEVHTAFLHPETGVKVRNEEMYKKYKQAENFIDVVSSIGSGAVKLADNTRKILLAVAAGGGLWIAIKSGKLSEWLLNVIS